MEMKPKPEDAPPPPPTPATSLPDTGVRALSPRRRDRCAMTATARSGAAPHRRLAQAACVLLALALAGLAPASAQAQVEDYISNLTSTGGSGVATEITSGPTSRSFAQMFETGSQSSDYPLQEVVLHLDNIGAGAIRVTIRENEVNDRPGNTRYTLTNPTSLIAGRNTFTAPAGATLAADTRYHIVAESTGGAAARWLRTNRRSMLVGPFGTDWSIDFPHLKSFDSAPWAVDTRVFLVAVRGGDDGGGGNAAPTGVPTISDDTPMVGDTLRADASTVSDPDGPASPTFTWQWIRVSGSTETRIPGATSASYTVVAADVGATLKVEASFTDDGGTDETVQSAETAAVGEALPTVTVTPGTTPVTEGSDAVFRLARTGDTAARLQLFLSISETGDMCRGSSCAGATASATIPAGLASTNLFVKTSDDSAHEADSVVTVTLAANAAYELGTDASAEVTVEDNDNAAPTGAPTIDNAAPRVGDTLTADASRVSDPDGPASLTFTWRWIRVSGGTDTPIAGATSARYTVVAADAGAKLKAQASFTDDDGTAETVESAETDTVGGAPLPVLSIGDASVAEGDTGSTTLDFTVTLDSAATEAVTVDWATSDGTATAGTDYTAGNGTLTFNAGDSSRTVSVTVAGDEVDEPDETFTVTLTNPSGATLGDDTATGTITNDDDDPTLTLVLTPDTITENGGASVLSATLDHASGRDTVVTVSVSPVGPATAADYSLSPNVETLELVIPAGDTASDGTFTITAVDNNVDAPHKTVTVSATAANEAGVTAPQDVTLTITDDDNAAPTGAPTISDTTPRVGDTLTADSSDISDADGPASPTFTWQWIRVSGGTETPIPGATSADYTVVAADLGAKLKVEASFRDDGGTDEAVPSAETAAVGKALPVVTVTPETTPVTEGDRMVFRLARTGGTGATLFLRYHLSETGDMVAGSQEGGSKPISILAGYASNRLHISTVDDGAHEADSVVTLTLEAGAAYELGADVSAEITVEDNDNAAPTGAPTIDNAAPRVGDTLTADGLGISDPDGLTDASFAWQWIRVSGSTDTRIPGATSADYTVVAADLGATLKAQASFTDDDGTAETVESAQTAAVGKALPTVTVVSDGDLTEGIFGTFTATRTGGDTSSRLVVRVEVSVTGDYEATQLTIIRIKEYRATNRFTVRTADDGIHEPHGTLTVTLQPSDDYRVGTPGAATAKILDATNVAPTGAPTIDDMTPMVGDTLTADASGIDDADGLTGATFAWQWIRVSGGTETRIPGATSASYTVVAADAGATLKAEASFTDDGGTEETVESAETGAVAGAPSLPTVTVAPVTSPVVESEDAQFTVTRTGVTTGALTVRYRVSETGAMVASGDEGAKTVSFSGNAASVTVSVPTADDGAHEADSVVTVVLTADAAYDLGTASASVTVEDDDNAAPTGAPTIDDTTPVVGQTLTADASGIDDADGLTSPTFTWRWLRVASGGGETEVGTGASYTVVGADRGSTLKVKATFTDDDGTEETIESEETAAVERPAVVTPSSDGDVTEGEPAVFTLTRTGSTAGTLRVKFDIEPSGGDFGLTLTADGTTTTFPVGSRTEAEATFPVGSSTMKVSLSTVDDNTHEADGTVFLTVLLSDDEVYALGDTDFATLKIRDNDNAAPTGAPTIDDTTPVVGETLTADASGVSDPDGPARLAFSWQWIRVSGGTETRIPGATSASYTVAAADVGATLKVKASFTDDGGIEETVESAATATVEAASLPTVTVTPVTSPVVESEDAQFTVTRTGVTTGALRVRYNVIETGAMVRSGDKGAKTVDFSGAMASVTVTVPTVSDNIHEGNSRVTVALTADAAYELGTEATARVLVKDDDDSPATGTVTVTGTAREGETLTANTSDIADEDGGLDTRAYVYQWVRTPAGGSDEDISGATSKTYVPVFADAGATLKVKVTVTDGEGHEATFTSAATSAVAALPEVTVASDGDVTEGSAAAFTLTRTGGSSAPWLIVNIKRSVSGDFGVVKFKTTSFPAGAATTRTRLHVADDEADEAHGAVTLTVLPGNGYRVGTPSAATAKIFDATNVAPTGAPTIDDTSPVVGEMLTADPSGIADADGLTSRTFTWQWVRVSGGTETPIDGATAVTYTVVAADVGATLKVKASFTDDGGIEETVESAATATVEAASPPTVTLVVTPASISENGGTSTVTARLDRASDEQVWLTVSVEPVSPAVASDYTLSDNKRLVIQRGNTTSSGLVTITAVDNDTDAPNKSVTVKGPADPNTLVVNPAPVTLTLEDDDDPPEVSVANASAREDAALVFKATLSRASARQLTVGYEIAPVTASAADYTGAASGTVTFAAGDKSRDIRLSLVDDSLHEEDETVTVTLSEPQPAGALTLGVATATGTITDNDDSPATGTVRVTGTAREGETLTADTSGIADEDGLDNAGYAWQWVRTPAGGSDEDISGATSRTYVPVYADAGATLKVRVTVTDDEGHQATFTSAATSAVAALPRPEVTVASDGDVTEGSPAAFTLTRTGDTAETLDVAYAVTATGNFGVTPGAGTATFPANSATVQVTVATTGDSAHETHGTVTVTLTADTSTDPAYLLGDPATATAAVEDDDNAAPTGAVTIDDTTPVVGQTLTADASSLDDPDGLTSRSFTWQWLRVSGGTETEITGATAVTYTVVAADVGAKLKVKATFTDDGGTEETVESAQTSAAKPPSPVLTVAAGTSRVTEGTAATFTVTRTVVTAGALTAHYQVSETGDAVAASDEGAKSVDFADGETGKTVTVPTAGDGGHEADSVVTVTLTADAAYDLGAQRSAEVTVEDDDNAAPTGAVTIDDTTPVVGQTLTADTSNLDDPDGLTSRSFTYQWLRVSGGTETVIAGASTASYPVAAADVGAMLKVRVGFTDDDGTAETVESAPTRAVAEHTITAASPRVTEGDDGSALLDFALTRSETGQRVELGWRVTTEGTAQPVRPVTDFAGPMEGTLVFPRRTRAAGACTSRWYPTSSTSWTRRWCWSSSRWRALLRG